MAREGIKWDAVRRKGSKGKERGLFESKSRKAIRRKIETVGSVLRLYFWKESSSDEGDENVAEGDDGDNQL